MRTIETLGGLLIFIVIGIFVLCNFKLIFMILWSLLLVVVWAIILFSPILIIWLILFGK